MEKVGAPSKSVGSRAAKASGPAKDFEKDDLGLSFFTDAPNVEVSIREFEELVLARLKLLHAFDRKCGYETSLQQIGEVKNLMMNDLNASGLSLGLPTEDQAPSFRARKAELVRRDSISHFALRLAFCKTRDSREWFMRQEQRLFVIRFDSLSLEAKEHFLKTSGLPCEKFQPKQGDAVTLQVLQQTTAGAKIWSQDASGRPRADYDPNFYTMPFQDVAPSLISGRKVVLHGGMAYVPSSALKMILAQKFKDSLIAGLDTAVQGLPVALADPRVGSFLRYVQDNGLQLLVAQKSSAGDEPGEKLTPENFDELLVRSFPPCMRRIVEKQRDMKKHLKHAGRLQLRPFLKECGFTMEESNQWWQKEMCRDPQVDSTSYDKNYAYDVEHAYGKKGHLQGQNSFGCPKIIGFPYESPGQVHGCPFSNQEVPNIKQMLHKWHVPEENVNEIEKLVNNGKHYQLACIEYFQALHPGHSGDGVGNAPGDFFRESCRHHIKKAEKEGKAPSPTKPEKTAGA